MRPARAAAFAIVLLLSAGAGATQFRRPFDASIALGYGFDHNGAAPDCQDYACGGACYDGHRGSDFPTPYGTSIVAAADGVVTTTNSGCPDVGFLGSQCGGGFGNYVRIQHADGKVTYHGHLKDGSILVGAGQSVTCGQKIGESASSGNSSGYHHHFEVRVGSATDPFAGDCSGPTSYWVAQNAYGTPPGAACEQLCACSGGQTESQPCGNCGASTRACDGCQWGGYGACAGEGPCAPGQAETQPCGDCGEQARTCGGDCQWGSWGDCGPPPCMPGQTETEACGNCGTRARACEGNCQWGGFSACGGEGECAPGSTAAQACGDCGQEVRVCGADCAFGGFGACGGPDPGGGSVACDTGLGGPCAEGRLRCVGGATKCLAVNGTGAEVCDGVDNDCNGLVDDGDPAALSEPPPALAAALTDMSAPQALEAGERAWVWADFRNVGTAPWTAGGLWLAPLAARGGQGSALYPMGAWPAWDVAAALEGDVAPGEVTRLAFEVQAPAEPGQVREAFQLEQPGGALVACPKADFEVALTTWARPEQGNAPANGAAAAEITQGCAAAGGRGGASRETPVLFGVALAVSALRRRRSRAGS